MCPITQDYGVCPHCGFVKSQYIHDDRLIKPETLLDNRYFIGKALYIDQFGASYLAFDEIMKRKIVIRQLIDNLISGYENTDNIQNLSNRTFYQFQKKERFIQFYNELSLLSEITAIPEIFTSGTADNITYAVYEYTSDRTIEDFIILNGKQNYSKTTEIIFPMIYALRELHFRNMYHGLINTRNLKMNLNNVAVMYEFPGIEINAQESDKGTDTIAHNQKNDVMNIIVLILMIMTGSIKPINKNSVNIEYFKNNEILISEKLQNFMISALDSESDDDCITIDNLLNAMYENLSVDRYERQSRPPMKIPKSVYETASMLGCKIKYCTTSLEDVLSEPPFAENLTSFTKSESSDSENE